MRTPKTDLVKGLVIAVFVAGAGASGCTGCLGYDKYHLANGPVGGGGAGGSGGSGGGGATACQPAGQETQLITSYVVAEGADASHGACGATGTPPGIELVELDARGGGCLATGHIAASKGTVLAMAPALRVGRDDQALVAGSFRKGSLKFPNACAGGGEVKLDGETDATAALFFALIDRQDDGFCTEWARRAFSSDAAAGSQLKIGAARSDAANGFAVTGSLGDALVHFGDATDTAHDLHGGPFLAVLHPADGSIVSLQELAGAASDDAALGLAATAQGWLATGAVENASPACHGCSGSDVVDGPKQTCPTGGGGGGGAGGASADPSNAMLWQPAETGFSGDLWTFGTDQKAGDAQIGFDVSLDTSPTECGAYWTGFAGASAWSIDSVGLFAGAGATGDAFLARLGGDAVGCGGSTNPFNVRFVPSIKGATAWGHRVAAQVCGRGPVAATAVRDAAGGRVALHRCSDATPSCDVTPVEAPLADGAAKQLLLTGFDSSGDLAWSSAVGPLVVDAAPAPLPGRAHGDLVADDGGSSYVVFTTDGPIVTENFQVGACDFVSNTDAGTWIIALGGASTEKKASCTWARRLGP